MKASVKEDAPSAMERFVVLGTFSSGGEGFNGKPRYDDCCRLTNSVDTIISEPSDLMNLSPNQSFGKIIKKPDTAGTQGKQCEKGCMELRTKTGSRVLR